MKKSNTKIPRKIFSVFFQNYSMRKQEHTKTRCIANP